MGLMELLHASVIWINWILTKTQHATGRRRHYMSHGLQSANKHRFTGSLNLAALSYCQSGSYFLKELNMYTPRGAVSSVRQLDLLNSIQHGWSALFQSSRKCCWAKDLPNPSELCIVASCFLRDHKASVKQSKETSKPTSSLKSSISLSSVRKRLDQFASKSEGTFPLKWMFLFGPYFNGWSIIMT